MPLFRPCPRCGSPVHVRKLACACGHEFRRSLALTEKHHVNAVGHKARKRALETEDESSKRRSSDSACKAQKRALETAEQTTERRARNAACQAQKRALETEEQSRECKVRNTACQAQKRALETEEQSRERKTRNTACQAYKRALETEEQSRERKTLNTACQAQKRASESGDQSTERKACNAAYKSKSRANVSLQAAIETFVAKTKQGPDYVCNSCHRLMYRQTVVLLDRQKYTKASPDVLGNVFKNLYSSFDDKYWVCKTCDGALSCGRMPVQVKYYGLQLSTIPPELSCLNALELWLISLRVPCMKMVALPSGKQRCIHGQAVNVPSKLDSVCTALPRLPSQSELIPLKFKLSKACLQGPLHVRLCNP